MEKAYGLKALQAKLLEKGLPEVELLSEKAYEAVKEWFVESAKMSQTPWDDMAIQFIGSIDAIVKPQLDKIDNKEG